MKYCTVSGCEKPLLAKGFCSMHWERWRKYGDPLAGRTPNGDAQRFLTETAFHWDNENCLIWPYGTSAGYPWIGRQHGHVIVCEHFHGPKPPDKEACHNCGMRRCLNWQHLRWDTHQANMADIIAEKGSGPRAKLTRQQVREIRGLSRIMGKQELADKYSVSYVSIWNIINRRTWAHLK